MLFLCDFTPDNDTNIKYFVFWYKNEAEIKVFDDVARPQDAEIDNTVIKKAGSQVQCIWIIEYNFVDLFNVKVKISMKYLS